MWKMITLGVVVIIIASDTRRDVIMRLLVAFHDFVAHRSTVHVHDRKMQSTVVRIAEHM